jgi:NADH dehydrogenase
MILVTGATGFIGRALVRQLADSGREVRVLLRSSGTPDLPRGVPVEAAVTSLADPRGLRAALAGVDTVYHLAGSEWRGARANLLEVDVQGTLAVTQAARDAGVRRILTVSHLGADRAAGYPVLKSKGIAEDHIRRSGLDYTIIRTALVFGRGDHFTTAIARLCFAQLGFFLLPGDGRSVLQPIWVDDLATILAWALDDESTRNHTYEIGGPEYFTFREIVETVARELGISRRLVETRPPYLRALTVALSPVFPGLPFSSFWIDYLAANRTAGLDTVPRQFGVLPSRFPSHLDYLRKTNWRRALMRSIFSRT